MQVGVKRPEGVTRWKNTGIKNAQELKKWRSLGVRTPQEVSRWMQAGIFSFSLVKECMDKGMHDPFKCEESNKHQKAQNDLLSNKKETSQSTTREESINALPIDKTYEESSRELYQDSTENVLQKSHTEQTTGIENTAYKYNVESSNDLWQLFLLAYFSIMIITMFKGYGENRTVVIFRDYNDLGLTFLIPASSILIYYLFTMFGGNPAWGVGLALVVAMSLFIILLKSTYQDNQKAFLPTVLSIMTKVPLGIIWIISFINMLNPGGKTAAQRRKNRASALMIMGLLTPIIGMLVVNKEGSFFNPKDWIKGRRIGGIRKHL